MWWLQSGRAAMRYITGGGWGRWASVRYTYPAYTLVPAQLEALLAALASRATNGSTSAHPKLSRGKLERMSENQKSIYDILMVICVTYPAYTVVPAQLEA